MVNTLIIGSCEPFSGKSALVLGIARRLKVAGKSVRFGKPLATSIEIESELIDQEKYLIDDDVRFVASILDLKDDQLLPSVQLLAPHTADKRIAESQLEPLNGFKDMQKNLKSNIDGLNILETAGCLHEGLLYGLSLSQVAKATDSSVLLVQLWRDSTSVDALLAAKEQLGDRLIGIVLNAVNPKKLNDLKNNIVPALGALGLDVYGVLPRSPLLRSVTVEELVRRLKARVLCCSDRLELLVETLSIGAMNVNSAMEFFRKRRNMAVVTGADRTDIQLAALEASTQCLILTGAGEPLPQLINRAEELEVPLLKVDADTLYTVEVIEQAFGHVRLHENVKASYAFRLVEEHCEMDRLFENLGIRF